MNNENTHALLPDIFIRGLNEIYNILYEMGPNMNLSQSDILSMKKRQDSIYTSIPFLKSISNWLDPYGHQNAHMYDNGYKEYDRLHFNLEKLKAKSNQYIKAIPFPRDKNLPHGTVLIYSVYSDYDKNKTKQIFDQMIKFVNSTSYIYKMRYIEYPNTTYAIIMYVDPHRPTTSKSISRPNSTAHALTNKKLTEKEMNAREAFADEFDEKVWKELNEIANKSHSLIEEAASSALDDFIPGYIDYIDLYYFNASPEHKKIIVPLLNQMSQVINKSNMFKALIVGPTDNKNMGVVRAKVISTALTRYIKTFQ